jgi:drug/metabolite transporter (DMT)-like permease
VSWGALVAVSLWGASFVAAKIALAELQPVQLILLRAILGALALDGLLLRGGWREIPLLTRHDWRRIGELVLISVFPHQLAQMVGLRQTTAINGALLITLAPLFMFALSAALLGEPVTRSKALGFLAAILGSALVITRGDLAAMRPGSGTAIGDLLIVVSAVGWALYSTLGKDLLRRRSPLLSVTLVFNLSLPLLIALAALDGANLLRAVQGLSGRGWAAVLFLSWGCSALAYVLWYTALQRQEMSRISVLQYLQPLVATLLGILLLDESIVWATAVGGGMILGGVALVNRRQ